MTGFTSWRTRSGQRTRFTAEGPDSSRRRANDLPSAVRDGAIATGRLEDQGIAGLEATIAHGLRALTYSHVNPYRTFRLRRLDGRGRGAA